MLLLFKSKSNFNIHNMSLSNLIVSLNNNVPKSKKKQFKETSNKMVDYQHSSIVYANDMYKKKMDKSQKKYDSYTFGSKQEFDSYIDNDIKSLDWKDVPLSTKYKLIGDYIQTDDTLSEEEKIDIQLRLKELVNTSKIISYDKKVGSIININYKEC